MPTGRSRWSRRSRQAPNVLCVESDAVIDKRSALRVPRSALFHAWDGRTQITAEYVLGGLGLLILRGPGLVRGIEVVDGDLLVGTHLAPLPDKSSDGRCQVAH